jgi:hypothetical protein
LHLAWPDGTPLEHGALLTQVWVGWGSVGQ